MTLPPEALGGRPPLAAPATLTDVQCSRFNLIRNTLVPWANQVPFPSITIDGRIIGAGNPALLTPGPR
jgi:hypothetical protein